MAHVETSMDSNHYKFPLPDNYFPLISLSPQQELEYVNLMNTVLIQTIKEETPYYETHYSKADSTAWKYFKSMGEFHIYLPTTKSSRMKYRNQAISMGLGTMNGRIENILLGLRSMDNQEAITNRRVGDTWLDYKILANIPTGKLPYQLPEQVSALQLKWQLLRTPIGKLVKHRDTTILEHIGMSMDDRGRPFAFIISYSVDIPQIPPFPQAANTIRMNNRIMYILRQVSKDRIGIFVRSEIQLDGQMPNHLKKKVIMNVYHTILYVSEIAQVKKLTILALLKSPVLGGQTRLSRSRSINTAPFAPTRQQQTYYSEPDLDKCELCQKRKGRHCSNLRSLFKKTKIVRCHICGLCICLDCSVDRNLAGDTNILPVICCKECIVQTQQWTYELTRLAKEIERKRIMEMNLQGQMDQSLSTRDSDYTYEESYISGSFNYGNGAPLDQEIPHLQINVNKWNAGLMKGLKRNHSKRSSLRENTRATTDQGGNIESSIVWMEENRSSLSGHKYN